ncbi:MAG TPA: hypothetical protein PKB09_01340 [Candidatus Saccharibacteria bacterium]|nr:hypothetical protein [Candidatus Saccharibacteria bacterium]
MSRILSQLLAAKEPTFSLALKQLEQDSGRNGIDIRLSTEISAKVREKTQLLGLDPDDTTPEELYHRLLVRIADDDNHLANAIGVKDTSNIPDTIAKIRQTVENMKIPRSCWVLKRSIAKKIIKQNPPRSVMKVLKYRSVDSMLKNENLGEIFGALRFVESSEWLNAFNESYESLKPSDFESRLIEIIEMPMQRWGDYAVPFIKKKRHNITHVKELGVILMLPIKEKKIEGITITVLPLLLHYINEIRLYSSFFKLKQMQPNFGAIVADTLNADPDTAVNMGGQSIHWRVLQRYFGKLEKENHPEIFEPHVQPEDLHWRSAESILYQLDPNLEFWKEMDYVAILDGNRPVTFNLMDTAVGYANKTPYQNRVIYHFRESLWNEIFARYMGEKTLEEQVLKQLDNDMIEPEKLEVSIS